MKMKIKLIITTAIAVSALFINGCGQDSSVNTNNAVKQKANKDMGRAKFTEALLNLEPIKQQIALCYNENGFTDNVQPECSSGHKGTVYRIPHVFSTTYFESISVEDGSIIATAKKINGLNGETYILDPYVNGNSLEWKLAPDSTCIQAGLC